MKTRSLEKKSYSLQSSPSFKSKWTQEQDEKLSKAMGRFKESEDFKRLLQKSKRDSVKFPWARFKQDYLSDLPKKPKQIQERWEQQISSEIKSSTISEEDIPVIESIYRRSILKNGLKDWVWMSQESRILLGYKYSPNSIKNLINRQIRKHELPQTTNTLRVPAALQKKESFDEIREVLEGF